MKKTLICLVIVLNALAVLSGLANANQEKTRWFTDARFGMFIHFGLYSLPAGVWEGEIMGRNMYAEWIQKQGNWPQGLTDQEYQSLAEQFNPVEFDAKEWVWEAKNAGMKYIVITSKHHDGFALWPSKVSSFNVMDATPFKRDILGELADACEFYDIKLGFYYSHWQDWKHPGGARPPVKEFHSVPPPKQVSDKEFEGYWQEKCLPQVKELIQNYHPALMWFDTWGKPDIITDERLTELIDLVRALDPDCLINSRILMKHPDIADKVDFISMGDNHFPKNTISMPWETSGTMNRSWGYHQWDYHWEPTGELLKKLVGNVSRNGNFQLNIGPKGNGEFPLASIRRLGEIGAWMAVNGEAIYASLPNPIADQDWGYITSRPMNDHLTRLYLHIEKWPQNGEIRVHGVRVLPEQVFVLESQQSLLFAPHHGSVTITLPHTPVDPKLTVVVMDVDRQGIE